MSKLDNIQTTCDNCEYTPALSETCKERIKALFIELIDNLENHYAYYLNQNIGKRKAKFADDLRQIVQDL